MESCTPRREPAELYSWYLKKKYGKKGLEKQIHRWFQRQHLDHVLTVNEPNVFPLSDNIKGDETFSRLPFCIQKSVWKWKGHCVKGNKTLLKRLKHWHLLKVPSEGHIFCWASLNKSSYIMSVRQRRLIQGEPVDTHSPCTENVPWSKSCKH